MKGNRRFSILLKKFLRTSWCVSKLKDLNEIKQNLGKFEDFCFYKAVFWCLKFLYRLFHAKTFRFIFWKETIPIQMYPPNAINNVFNWVNEQSNPRKDNKSRQNMPRKNCPKLTTGSKFDCAEEIIKEQKTFFKSTNLTYNNKSRIFQQFPFFRIFLFHLFIVANFFRYIFPQTNSSYLPVLF